jgi:hypothetical protein
MVRVEVNLLKVRNNYRNFFSRFWIENRNAVEIRLIKLIVKCLYTHCRHDL